MYQNHLVKPRKPKNSWESLRDAGICPTSSTSTSPIPTPQSATPTTKMLASLRLARGASHRPPIQERGLEIFFISLLYHNSNITNSSSPRSPLHVPLPAPAWSSRQSHTHCAALQPVQSTLQVCPKKPRGRRPPPRGGLHTPTAVYTPAGAALLVSGRLAAVVMPLRSGTTPLRSRPNKQPRPAPVDSSPSPSTITDRCLLQPPRRTPTTPALTIHSS